MSALDVRSALHSATTTEKPGPWRKTLNSRIHGICTLLVTATADALSEETTTQSQEDVARRLEAALAEPRTQSWNGTFECNGRIFLAVLLPSSDKSVFDSKSKAAGYYWELSTSTSTSSPAWSSSSSTAASASSESLAKLPQWHSRHEKASPKSRSGQLMDIVVGATLTVVALAAAFVLLGGNTTTSKPDETLLQYEVGASEGPLYSTLLTLDNTTDWKANYYDPAKYYIRIDEQALIPIELLDEQEARYQEYLAKRYPEKAELRDSAAFLDPDFFYDPNNFMLPSDMEFHRGHCVRAMRRYWQAKETGKHVAPWDIDYRHLHHCFSMLEEVMMPPGPRAETDGEPVSMSWRTKVVMWEM